MKTAADLQKILGLIDRKSYSAYKEIKGGYDFGMYHLFIDHVQGDPFAAPSSIRVQIDEKIAGFPKEGYASKERKIALSDYLLRLFGKEMQRYSFQAKGSGKSGFIGLSDCGQKVLSRTACNIEESGDVVVRLEVGFPANGRTICAKELEKILFVFLKSGIEAVFLYKKLDAKKVEEVLFLADDQCSIRDQLDAQELVAFVANGSMLPRRSGVSDEPMKEGIAFSSPAFMEVTLTLPHKGKIKGMGIKKGITLIVGGGYHGKSTLLKSLEGGVYNHIAGDGREYVITKQDGMKIRAEDGRSVTGIDLTLFVNNLPSGKDTKRFSTEDASGSTSQAANVIEAIESGSSLLLIDEDTCATNFMVRDELMQRVVHKDKEPITSFIQRANLLYEQWGISTILVAGSSGAYFQIANTIVQMDQYEAKEITQMAKKESEAFGTVILPDKGPSFPSFQRIPVIKKREKDDNRLKIKGLGKDSFLMNKETVSLQFVEQLVDPEQTIALGYLLAYAKDNLFNGKSSVKEIVDKLMMLVEDKGLEAIVPGGYLPAGLAMPRRQELFACINRYRGLRFL